MTNQCTEWAGGVFTSRQCSRRAVKDGLCHQHHPGDDAMRKWRRNFMRDPQAFRMPPAVQQA